jgi:hypothetical protein
MRWLASTAVLVSFLVLGTVSWSYEASPERAAADRAAGAAAANTGAAGLHAGTPYGTVDVEKFTAERAQGGGAGTSNYYDHVQPTHGSGAVLTNSAVKPLTQGTQLKNLNGVDVGVATYIAPSNTPLLAVTMLPNFGTGDIQFIDIRQDLDADGTLEYHNIIGTAYSMVSGVCGNGVIMCPPGTFSDASCKFERWATNTSGGLLFSSALGSSTTKADLSNCYCFNNYCSRFNNSAVANADLIQQEISGSLIAHFMQKRPDLVVSSVSEAAGSVSYYGTKMATLSQVPGYTAPKVEGKDYGNLPVITANTPDIAVDYYRDGRLLEEAAITENTAMAANPKSLYSMINALQSNQGLSTVKCVKQRVATVSGGIVTSSYLPPFIPGTACTSKEMNLRLVGRSDNKTFDLFTYGTCRGSDPGCSCATPVLLATVAPPGSINDDAGYNANKVSFRCTYTHFGETWAPEILAHANYQYSYDKSGALILDPDVSNRSVIFKPDTLKWKVGPGTVWPSMTDTELGLSSGEWFAGDPMMGTPRFGNLVMRPERISYVGMYVEMIGIFNQNTGPYFASSWDYAVYRNYTVDSCELIAEYKAENSYVTETNGCAVMESPGSGCQLWNETWDSDHPVLVNGNPTGWRQITLNCKDFPGQLRSYRICKDWWRDDKTFTCTDSSSRDFNTFLTQLQPIALASQRSAVMPSGADTGGISCEISCKTEMPRKDTLVRTLGVDSDVKAQTAVTASGFDTFIKLCTVSGSTYTCPVDAAKNETIVVGCGCLSACNLTCDTKIPIYATGGLDEEGHSLPAPLGEDGNPIILDYDKYEKQCTANGSTNICPLDATKNETVVNGCGCRHSEFATALAQTEGLTTAAKDAICSNTPPDGTPPHE